MKSDAPQMSVVAPTMLDFGRIALHELLLGTEQAKTAIKKQYLADEIKNLSLAENMKSMKMDGIIKVFQGMTDLKQVLKVCN